MQKMKIYISASSDCPESIGKYEIHLTEHGNELCRNEPDELNRSDGVLICVSGSENSDAKAELNMALERKLPIAYIVEKNAYLDSGFRFQLGLAHEIPEDDFEELDRWLKIVYDISRNRKIQNRRKKIIVITVATAICIATAILVLIYPGKTGKIKNDGGTEDVHSKDVTYISSANAEESRAEEASRKYLGEDPVSVKKLDISNKGITDISFLSAAENLEELDISNNQITDINVLVTLKNLKKLNISGNPIEDDTVLDYMKNVEIIY